MTAIMFARLQADVDVKIRRGAWYRVLELRELDAVIEVNRKPVKILKAMLEIQRRPPLRWSVVNRPPAARVHRDLGSQYGVCPSCRTRAPIPKKARALQCPRCKQEYPVNWGEDYLKA